jgi:molybdate transport system substrate-binding protein
MPDRRFLADRSLLAERFLKERFLSKRCLAVALVVPLAALPARGATPAAQAVTVAAAADLQSVLPDVVERFERETGRKVALTFGSSGNFFSQIQNGAPFDLFFSADIDYPRRLEAAGLAESGSLYEYATGRIVVWSRKDSGIELRRGLQVLADSRVRRVAIANPEHAPYGRAAVAALQHEKLYDRVRSKLVLGENISQAAQFVQSGNSEAGIIALSLALAPALRTSGDYFEIPASFYPAIEQAAVMLRASRNKDAARQFVAFLRRPEIVRLLQDFGFAVSQHAAGRD